MDARLRAGQAGLRRPAAHDRQDRRRHADDRRRISRRAARRPRGLHLRRAREGRDRAPGLPQHRAHDRAPLRRAARSEALEDKLIVPTDTGNGGYTHAFFKAPKIARRAARRPRRDRRMGAHHLWLDRPLARLQGGVPRHARRQRRFLRSLSGQCQALVQVQPGARALHQPRHHPSAGRPRPPAERGGGCLRACREGDRRRHHRLRRQGGGDRLGADQLHLRRPSRADRRCRTRISPSSS